MLGDRHSSGVNPPHPTATSGSAPFIIRKSSRYVDITSPAVTNVHGTKWMAELKEMCYAAESRLTENGKELVRSQHPSGRNEEKPRLHEGDLYLCAESLAAFEGALGGVLDAVDSVFKPAGPHRVFACVRPPGHHCSDDYPSGFCWLNNVHVGISHAAIEHGLTHAAIFDFDLHHGDGSQSIAWTHNSRVLSLPKSASLSKKTAIGYYSLHDINSYPCEWGDEDKVQNASLCIENAHGQSIWNVHLQPWKTEADFWELYENRYSVLIEKMRGFLKSQYERFRSMGPAIRPKGAIFISAGFDASEWESQGMQRHKVNVPTEFYARVTRDIVKLSEEEGLGVDGRVVSVLEGGYSDRALASGVLSHICGLTSTPAPTPRSNGQDEAGIQAGTYPVKYQANWWSPTRLEELEKAIDTASLPASAKKSRPGTVPSYHSPTQSFVAKVVSQPTYQRSVANSLSKHSYERSRTPTPPPPDVDWVTASYELSQLIIPSERQTRSCKSEELNTKATEVRKSRQSTIGLAMPKQSEDSLENGLEKMNLKSRRMNPPPIPLEESHTTSSAASAAADRRKTFGGVEVLDKEIVKRSDRRMSVASAKLSTADDSIISTSSVEPVSAPKVRALPKPRVPKKTVVKPTVPRSTSASKKTVDTSSATNTTNSSTSKINGDMDAIVSGVKNIRLKLNPPTKPAYEVEKSSVTKELKKLAVRAPRKPTANRTASKETVSKAAVRRSPPSTSLAALPIKTPEPPVQHHLPMHSTAASDLVFSQHSILSNDTTQTISSQQNINPTTDTTTHDHSMIDPELLDYQPTNPPTFLPSNKTSIRSQPSNPPTSNPSKIYLQPTPTTQIAHAQRVPPNTNYSTSSSLTQPHNHLPNFSSHGPIPFAPTNNSHPTHIQSVSAADENLSNDAGNGFGPDHGYDGYQRSGMDQYLGGEEFDDLDGS